MYKSDKRLYVNKAGDKIVAEDDPDVGSLLVGEGGEIPESEAEKYGLMGEKASKAQAQNKAAPKAEDK